MFLILLVFTPSYADLWKVRDFWLNQARMIMVILIPIEKNKQMLVRARVELTTLALSAPRSADWANRPDILHSFLVRCVCLQERHSIKWVTHGKAILHQVALKKSTSIFGKRPGTMKNKTKELKIVFTEFMSFSQKNDQESPVSYTSENLSEAYTSGI